ncbi:MAG: hypothetical protein UV66_C0007G0006 [Candidatus Woesebacteria bacterium GW2011_GWA1_43_12]|uniref:Uncharacterized protein n=1 Tax=Candidatus Woesebacteria bacterium GW2011_GWA1_43_12 TaxID=1618557 RepID=A0A0G1CXE6_9BACT|nr:MAG: hypothetical protein UV66_C0007G0006 [Candidatus Woesebacteria bacterium GW2011_GWA1_43_12]
MQKIQIILIVITFYIVGGMIDFWQSAKEHNKKIPQFLLDYFLIFWLIIYSGILPFLLVFVASNYNFDLAKTFIGAMLIGISLWDLVYSIFDTKSIVSPQKIYFCVKGKNYGLSKQQLYIWHAIRWIAGIVLLVTQ